MISWFLSQCDLNRDGKITEEEFLKAGLSIAELFELESDEWKTNFFSSFKIIFGFLPKHALFIKAIQKDTYYNSFIIWFMKKFDGDL